jgi:TetR/AcrR family transcriptional regulator, transcriptional repressor for nem operon
MSKALETRARIIERAAVLFNRQGFAGTSMSELMQATDLKKGGIYNHFHSKDELAISAFDYAVDRVSAQISLALKGKRRAIDRLNAMCSVYERMSVDPPIAGGCPLLNTAIDSDDTHPALRDRTRQAMDRWRELIARIVTFGIDRGEIRSTVDPNAVATIAISTIEGAVMLGKLYDDPSYLHTAIDHLRDYFQSLAASG